MSLSMSSVTAGGKKGAMSLSMTPQPTPEPKPQPTPEPNPQSPSSSPSSVPSGTPSASPSGAPSSSPSSSLMPSSSPSSSLMPSGPKVDPNAACIEDMLCVNSCDTFAPNEGVIGPEACRVICAADGTTFFSHINIGVCLCFNTCESLTDVNAQDNDIYQTVPGTGNCQLDIPVDVCEEEDDEEEDECEELIH